MNPRKPRRRYLAKADPPVLLPPNLGKLEGRPFTAEDGRTLRGWLAEPGWPRGTMDIAMLEGYLVALLVWPVGISSGAWLPSIWGEEAGWRVPAKIATQETFDRFIELVVGLLRDLDSRLDDFPVSFVPTLLPDERSRRGPRSTGVSWAHGFLRALQQNAQGMRGRSDAAWSAVTCIARYGSLEGAPTPAGSAAIVANLTSATVALLSERPSRGPLGALKETSLSPNIALSDAARRMRRHHD